MGLGGGAAHGAAADFHHQDRLTGATGGVEAGKQARRLSDAFGVEHDDLGGRILDHHLQHVTDCQIGFVAGQNHG